jgi:hypothetical protein
MVSYIENFLGNPTEGLWFLPPKNHPRKRPGFHWLYSLSIYMAGFIGSTDMLFWLYSHQSKQKKLPFDRII